MKAEIVTKLWRTKSKLWLKNVKSKKKSKLWLNVKSKKSQNYDFKINNYEIKVEVYNMSKLTLKADILNWNYNKSKLRYKEKNIRF